MPLVTILIPTYNREHFLGLAIGSALAQSYQEIEVVVLDDCSSEPTSAVAQSFSTDARVRHVRHPQNVGIAQNWRLGIGGARGDYFCLLHDDDTLEPGFVEALMGPLENDPSLILSFCDQWVMDAAGHRLPKESSEYSNGYGRDTLAEGPLEDFASKALIENTIPAGAALYRRSLILPQFIDDRAKGSIDMWLLYQCIGTGKRAYFVSSRLMNYRIHAQGMSRSMPYEMIEGHLFRYRQMLKDSHLVHLHKALNERLSEALEWYGMALLRSKRFQESRAAFREALAIKPRLKSLAGLALGCLSQASPPIEKFLIGVRNQLRRTRSSH